MLTKQEWWTAAGLVAIMFSALALVGAQETTIVPTTDIETTVEAFSDDPQHWAPVNENRYAGIIGRLRAQPSRAYWGADERRKLADDIDGLALSADDPGPQSIVMAIDQLRRVANGLRARSSFSPPQLVATLGDYVQAAALPRGPPAGGIETLQRQTTAGPTPNESYLAKQMQGTMAACMAPMIWELSNGAPDTSSPWLSYRVNETVHTPTDWRTGNQVYHYRGTVSGQPSTGAYVKFTNYRYDPEHSSLNYGPKKVAQDVNVNNAAKTKLIQNKSDAPVDVSYDESVSETDSFSTNVTHGMTMDLSVDSTQTIEGGYGGISASVSMQEHFGVSKTSEESKESSEEGTHEESLSIEFTAAPSEFYLVTIAKEHAVTYQDFRIDGVADFDMEIGFGSVGGGHQRHRKPSGTVHVQGVAGFEQFVNGFDTDYPSMQGFMGSAYTRTKDGINCVLDPDRRTVTVAGTDQANLESNADYTVESLGQTVPDHLKHLPVEDAGDVQ